MGTERVRLAKSRGGAEMGKKAATRMGRSAILYPALAVIAILAIPMCLFLGAIAAVWAVTDKLIRRIEGNTEHDM